MTSAQADTSAQSVTSPTPGSVMEVADDLRSDLLGADRALRVLSQDVAGMAPVFAARLKVAAHLVHNAASALSSEGLDRAR